MFGKKQQSEFDAIKDLIEKKMAESQTPKSNLSNLYELEKLAELKEKGIVTEEEFSLKKKQLLGI